MATLPTGRVVKSFSLRDAFSKLVDLLNGPVSEAELTQPGRVRNAYIHGYQDFDDNDHHNPYRKGSKEHAAWKIGYDQNDREGRPM